MKKRPSILALPTQLWIFIEISRIELPGNQVEIFISLESASFTESEPLLRLQKNFTGKKLGFSEFGLKMVHFKYGRNTIDPPLYPL